MTLKSRIARLLAAKPQCCRDLSARHGIPYEQASSAMKALHRDGAIEFVHFRNRCAIYRATGKPVPEDGRGLSPGSAEGRKLGHLSRPKVKRATTASELREDVPRVDGYGSGRIALEMAWPVR